MSNSVQTSIDVFYKVKFTNKNPVPVEELVETLLAYEKLLKRVGPFIEIAFDGSSVLDIEVLVSKIESGSLIEEFIVRIIFSDQENYEKAKEVVKKMLDNNPVLTTAVCFGVAAYIGFGIHNAVISQKGATAPTTHIVAQYGAIVQTAGTMNISEEAVNRILNETRDKKRLSKEAIAAISPAHLEDDASIVFNDNDEIKITPEFVKEAPEKYEPPEYSHDNEVLLKTKVEIWASDRESLTRSWAGIVPGKIEKRVKFTLDESVDPNLLHGHRNITADIVIVWYLPPGKKEFSPKKVEILKVYPEIR